MDGDVIRIDLNTRTADVLLSDAVLRTRIAEVEEYASRHVPASQTPWQEIFRREVGELSDGMVLKDAVKFQRVAQSMGLPRRNH